MVASIRKATPPDAPAIVEIVRGVAWFTHLEAEPVAVTEQRVLDLLDLDGTNPSHSLYVAEDSAGTVVGYVAVHWFPYLFLPGPEGYVSELFVREDARGQGVGSQLLATVRREAEERGCFRLMLLNNRHRESYQRRFYEKAGWQERDWLVSFILPLD